MNTNKFILATILLATLIFLNSVSAIYGKEKSKRLINEQKAESKYSQLLKQEHKTVKGLFTIHKISNKLYVEIPVKLLNREMLLGSTISATSDNGNGIVGSKPNDPIHFTFTKSNNKIIIRLIDATDIKDINGANNTNNENGAIFKLFNIECYSQDSLNIVADLSDLFISDDPSLSPFDKFCKNSLSGQKKIEHTFYKEKSFIDDIAAFEDNICVKSTLTYKYTIQDRGQAYKNQPFTASLTRSILLLDSLAYMPRITDSRIAIFPTSKISYSPEYQGTKKIHYANRWRLEPKDKEGFLKGEKVEPIKPIIFYIDSTFPKQWQPYIMQGVEQWNLMFEKIGFKNAIKALSFPKNDNNFNPDNLKYSCVRYAPIAIQNAMGPSWTDPRSGEIISASVYLYHDVIELINNWLFVQTSQVDKRVRTVNIPQEIIGDALRYVVSHEIGHCLGFMHNMSASAMIPVDSLRSATFTNKYGTTTSIMDYARFNYVAQPQDSLLNLRLSPPLFGPYDEFLVKWNYSPLFCENAEEEYIITSKWLSEAYKNPIYRFGKQQYEILDPRSQTEDLGDDAIKASNYGISNLKYILKNLNKWLDTQDLDFSYRKTIYSSIVNQYLTYLGHVHSYIGGIYLNEKHSSDLHSTYQTVDYHYQESALKFLLSQLKDINWIDNEQVRNKLPLTKPLSSQISRYIMELIMNCPSKTELCSAKSGTNPFTPQICLDIIYHNIWEDLKNGKSISKQQMQNQDIFIANICEQSGYKSPYKKESLASLKEELIGSKLGYSEPGALYLESSLLKSDSYKYLIKIKEILNKNINNKDNNTALYCKLTLLNIEKALNN